MPDLSVITINYNDAAGLEKTMQSVIAQTGADVEFIVIDGGSTDGSIDIIKKYADKISFWCSEKDKGIYDAQNKGVLQATANYLIFLNAGDSFFDQSVISKFKDFSNHNPKKLIYGNSVIVEADGSKRQLIPAETLDLNFWYANTLNHQALFFHRSLFEKYGSFDIQFRFAADFDLLFRIYVKEPAEFFHMNEFVCHYDNTGLTSKDEYHKIIIGERKLSMLKYVSKGEFQKMRKAYLDTRSFKKKYTIIITENTFLRTILKPVYKLYKRIF
ncbi:MAG TPA: glycosyltransferase family 2 protein [Bacteroidia bacterium]|jgi:glycosyltransferase involved in cell wall biosynthesis